MNPKFAVANLDVNPTGVNSFFYFRAARRSKANSGRLAYRKRLRFASNLWKNQSARHIPAKLSVSDFDNFLIYPSHNFLLVRVKDNVSWLLMFEAVLIVQLQFSINAHISMINRKKRG